MTVVFYVSAAVAVASTIAVISQANAVHALLYLVVSLLAVAVMFFSLGAPFVAALEVIIYAGAIMVLFVFVIMILNLGPPAVEQERRWLDPRVWVGPALLALVLVGELIYVLGSKGTRIAGESVDARQVGAALFGTYLLAVELASLVLLAALVGAWHLGQRAWPEVEPPLQETERPAEAEAPPATAGVGE